ncbi:acyloxyacyl hydrolase [Persicitalea sp.]|uniref:acyloxyacyl hydrolase n=1 Tax=Persicitalea sp. TaxID=3100273 RepID=UPI00359356A1
MKCCCKLGILLLIASEVSGQGGFSIQAGFQHGNAVTSHQNSDPAQQYGFTLDLNRQTSGEKYWQADHKYPQIGLQLAGRFFPGNRILKNNFTLIPYLEFNVWKSDLGTLQVKHGTGLAYVSGDLLNSDQPLLGTRLNAATMLDLGYQFKSKTALEIKVGALVSHLSNGNTVQPNAGLNSALAYINLAYFPGNKLDVRRPLAVITDFKRWRFRIGSAVGFHDYTREHYLLHKNWQVSLLAFRQHTTRFRTGLGLETGRLGSGSKVQPAVYLEEEVLIGHLVTRYGLGAYLTQPLPNEGRIYEKVGIAWYPGKLENQIAQGFSVGTNIKAHGFRAAHVEVTAGFLIGN